MYRIATVLLVLGFKTSDYLKAQHQVVRTRFEGQDLERGSVTIEQVIWAVAVIGFAAIVATAILNYINSQAAKIS